LTKETDIDPDQTTGSHVDAMISEGGPVFASQISHDAIDDKATIDEQARDRKFFRRKVERNIRRGQFGSSVRRAIDPQEHSTGD